MEFDPLTAAIDGLGSDTPERAPQLGHIASITPANQR
jgi:hypothetical protein